MCHQGVKVMSCCGHEQQIYKLRYNFEKQEYVLCVCNHPTRREYPENCMPIFPDHNVSLNDSQKECDNCRKKPKNQQRGSGWHWRKAKEDDEKFGTWRFENEAIGNFEAVKRWLGKVEGGDVPPPSTTFDMWGKILPYSAINEFASTLPKGYKEMLRTGQVPERHPIGPNSPPPNLGARLNGAYTPRPHYHPPMEVSYILRPTGYPVYHLSRYFHGAPVPDTPPPSYVQPVTAAHATLTVPPTPDLESSRLSDLTDTRRPLRPHRSANFRPQTANSEGSSRSSRSRQQQQAITGLNTNSQPFQPHTYRPVHQQQNHNQHYQVQAPLNQFQPIQQFLPIQQPQFHQQQYQAPIQQFQHFQSQPALPQPPSGLRNNPYYLKSQRYRQGDQHAQSISNGPWLPIYPTNQPQSAGIGDDANHNGHI